MRYVVIVMLLAIIASLGAGLYYLRKDREGSPRLLRMLKLRVALSVLLILFLLVSYSMGWLIKAPAGP